jgi:natural product precursor
MKTISKLRLNALSEANLLEREMNALKGGTYCSCSCYYANTGGSSSSANRDSNYNSGYTSTSGCNDYIKSDDWGGNSYCPGCKDASGGWY